MIRHSAFCVRHTYDAMHHMAPAQPCSAEGRSSTRTHLDVTARKRTAHAFQHHLPAAHGAVQGAAGMGSKFIKERKPSAKKRHCWPAHMKQSMQA